MFIIKAKYILCCDENFTILKDLALVFDEKIIEIADFNLLCKKYPKAKFLESKENSLILPAFINPHTHLEFSANNANLHYGDFLSWLKSVMSSRDCLQEKAREELILSNIRRMQEGGTSVIGEISSFAKDIKACAKSSARIILFNEILGVNKKQNEYKKEDFIRRFNESKKYESNLFTPAISLHSPYSLNLDLAKFAITFARENDLLISTHFLESKYEKIWLQKSKGAFKKWLSSLEKDVKPSFSEESFIRLFKGQRTLFTHCVFLDNFEFFDKNLHSISHCAFSNRLLSKKTLSLPKVFNSGLNIHLASDGLSSNISLCMLDEMRANLLIHNNMNIKELAKKLILMATNYPAKALNLKLGQIAKGYEADFSVFEMPSCDDEQLALQFILNSKKVDKLFIKGSQCI